MWFSQAEGSWISTCTLRNIIPDVLSITPEGTVSLLRHIWLIMWAVMCFYDIITLERIKTINIQQYIYIYINFSLKHYNNYDVGHVSFTSKCIFREKTDDRADNPPCLCSCVTDVSEGACLIHLCVFLSNLVVLLFSVPQNSKVIFSKAFHIRLPISSRCPDNIPDAVINVYGRFVSSKLRGI